MAGRKALRPGTHPDPVGVFRAWLDAAKRTGMRLPEATTLATATRDGVPSARVVLLRGVDRDGFVFYTSYESRKARELRANPRAALVFHWRPLGRQVRIEGRVERVSSAEAADYFRTRPRSSRVSAWASPQSSPIPSRAFLLRRVARIAARHRGRPVPCPPSWGGFRVVPDRIEFWIHRAHRLHDRFEYRRRGRSWARARLAP